MQTITVLIEERRYVLMKDVRPGVACERDVKVGM